MKTFFATALFALLLLPLAAAANYVSPERVDGTNYVDAAQAKALFDRGVPFIDVRTASDFDAGRIPGAVNVTVERDEAKSPFTAESLGQIVGKGDEVVFYCNSTSCWRTAEAAARAVQWGFTKVYYFRFGFPGWREAGYPVE